MAEEKPQRIGAHDLGGLPGGQIDRAEHDAAFWEQRVDAMVMLMMWKGVLKDAAQLRQGIEALEPDVYEKLSYYERWAGSAAYNAIRTGLVTEEELERRIEEVRARKGAV